jgi:hypothetical protein
MGPTEALKKLLDEKNVTIKKLIRDKNDIYQKMTTNYH